ncbi:MAG: YigZ family protein, partial [Chloroflexota bacterium]|nr:YigZ family protein [Chloroflexota bacterium]
MCAGYERTIRGDAVAEIEVRKSRFICSLVRVSNEQDARGAIDDVRKRHWDAHHHCTAWQIGVGGRLQRSSDDGEPAGTAGTPMLEVLIQRDVTDTLAVVTRYFGGAKLGAG